MKINKIEVSAVIPTQQYGNIQPSIELSGCTLEEGNKVAMGYISGMFSRYSEKGELKTKDVVNQISKSITKKSFNEDVEVEVCAENHTYHYKGKELEGATTRIKKYYKEFDAENISKASARSWGVDQQDVKDIWESNGDLTSLLGQTVHGMIEHYYTHEKVGAEISANREEDENYCIPKHPILKKILLDFLKLNVQKGVNNPEVLITDVANGQCGTADNILVLDEKKKICRVQDWKINIGSLEVKSSLKPLAPYNTMPSTKITKYQLQLSDYAKMLQKSGWVVEGLDVFVLEDEWKCYKLSVLE